MQIKHDSASELLALLKHKYQVQTADVCKECVEHETMLKSAVKQRKRESLRSRANRQRTLGNWGRKDEEGDGKEESNRSGSVYSVSIGHNTSCIFDTSEGRNSWNAQGEEE